MRGLIHHKIHLHAYVQSFSPAQKVWEMQPDKNRQQFKPILKIHNEVRHKKIHTNVAVAIS